MNSKMPLLITTWCILLLFHSLATAAELILTTEKFTPQSTLELSFNDPMITEEQVGSIADKSPLVINPPISGQFKWISTRSGQYTFTSLPAISTDYTFALAPNLKNAEGKPVASELKGSIDLSTEPFQIVDTSRGYSYDESSVSRRIPEYLLQFNDNVDPEKVAEAIQFIDKTKTKRIAAKARIAAVKDFRKHYISSAIPTWEELAQFETIVINSDTQPRANAIVVTSAEPLPVGEDWSLHVTSKITNLSNQASLSPFEKVYWGSIQPLIVKEVTAQNHFDGPPDISVRFNKQLHQRGLSHEENITRITPHIRISPPVPNMKIDFDYSELLIAGDFELNTPYDIIIDEKLSGSDELPLEAPIRETVNFTASPIFLSTTAEHSTQQAHGNGILDFYAANFNTINLRVKKLTQGELIQARALLHDTYLPNAKPEVAAKAIEKNSFEDFPGTLVYENSFANEKPIQKPTLFHLKWSEILGETPAAPVFLEFVATPQDGAPAGTIINRAIVEFTDIGLLIKNNRQEIFAYAFSYKTGQPLPNVQLTLMDKDRGFLSHATTGPDGVAKVKGANATWILARNGEDATALNLADYETRISLWSHHIEVNWGNPFHPSQDTLFFSDRPIYKPGDTAHLKAITRQRSGDALRLTKNLKAKLVVRDPRNREILNQPITFGPNGTWSYDLSLPEASVGYYTARIVFPKSNVPKSLRNAEEDESEDEYDDSNTAYLDIRVDEYKPNSFEVQLAGDKYEIQSDHISVPLTANYYMGKPLNKATAYWSASLDSFYIPPEEYSAYHFGDVHSWWRYGQDSSEDTASNNENEDSPSNWSASGEVTFNDEGSATIKLPTIPPHKASLPQTVSLYAEVTDINNQTITSETSFQIPGAEFLVGARTSKWYAQVNKSFHFEFVAITPEGKPFPHQVPVQITIERQQWNTVRVESASGAITTKNQSILIREHQATITLNSANDQAAIGVAEFTPKNAGTYYLTATALDAQGKTVLSRIAFYTLGSDTFPWSWDEGSRITLQPDKTSVKPGEDITIVVKSPLTGKALVTVERNYIHRHFLTDITTENPVITIKAEDIDAPNAFVSVVLIRGADASPQPDALPEYKVGYCNIRVQSDVKKLYVDLQPSQDPIQPAQVLTITTTVKDSTQQPVANAEVTLYAVDEGVLSLMGYQTPNPMEIFQPDASLGISNHISIDALIPEDLKSRYRGNKGIIIGGGGDEANADAFLRKNFVATALWQANLVTDENGKITHTFKVPDNLTRYRIMAIAVHGADRFGSAESSFTINKPLMIEPAMPRFAHRGDELLVKAIVHNTTAHRGQVEVELKLDENAELIHEERPFVLISQNQSAAPGTDKHSERRVITLEPNQTAAVSFPIHFVKNGNTTWRWSAKTTEWNGEPLVDGLETTIKITHPAPSLREVKYVNLSSQKSDQLDLAKVLNPQLMESEGNLTINFSTSRLSEARDALGYVLQYPYGCVEQTSSRVLPWLVLSKYESLFPDLIQKDKARENISRGVQRILTMQTDSGGLAYWPGGEDPQLWASAYGGFVLYKAKEWGLDINQANLDQLAAWISEHLREIKLAETKDHGDLNDAALALYTLAKAGKAEPSYQNILYSRRQQLSETARAYLALAMCITEAPAKQITELIKPVPKPKNANSYWLGDQTVKGLQLIVCAHLGLTQQAEALTEELYQNRKANGHWNTTFSNAWILLGLSTNERAPKDGTPRTFQLTINDKTTEYELPAIQSTLDLHQPLQPTIKQLKVQPSDNQQLRARVAVEAWPDPKTFQQVSKGFTLKRSYQRLTTSGSLEPAEQLRVGDMIVVTLDIGVQKPGLYLAVEDHLPSVFEPINPEFTTQNARGDAEAKADDAWYVDHSELRNDKALFFTNDWSVRGQFKLKYLARVIAEGDVIAPPAKIEAMYDPEHYALTTIDRIVTLPSTKENIVKK